MRKLMMKLYAKKTKEVKDDIKKSKLPPSSSSLSVSLGFGNQFLNHSSDKSISPSIHIVSSATTPPPPYFVSTLSPGLQQTKTPIPTPPVTTKAPPIATLAPVVTTISDPLPTISQRVYVLEKDVQEFKVINHTTELLTSLRSEIPLAVNAYLGSNLGDVLQKAVESLFEYELKTILFDNMEKSRSYLTHDKNQDLYDALFNSLCLDDVIACGQADPEKILRKAIMMMMTKTKTILETSKGNAPTKGSKSDKSVHVEESIAEPTEEPWFNNMLSAVKDPLTFDKLMATHINFSNFVMNLLMIDKLTKAHFVGPIYNLLKGTCQSSIELEYNIDECYKALIDQLDWNNSEGDRCPYDLSKPFPLKGHPGRLTVPSESFFNNDLEYLKALDPIKKYTMSITKIKAARYESQINKFSKHDVYSTQKILSVVSVKIKKLHGYGHLEEIVDFPGISAKELYTLSFDPPGAVYEDLNKQKRVMQADELYKFLDGTLKLVRDELHHRVLNFRLGYNKEMYGKKWSTTDMKVKAHGRTH
ncbi:hypothetical protein Tco_1568303 [Tanacetum coccineum]